VDNNTTPAFVDAHSAQYILHKSLGDTLIIQARSGPVNLKIIGLLQTSIFQSEILISEPAFLRAFPEIGGYQYFLTDVPADSVHLASAVLENVLGDFGLDMQETTAKLAAFQEVENTYLGVFQMLGGLGLLLGTLGLGVVLFRNLLERRSELAVLRAIGYTFPDLAKQLVLENILIIIWGLLLGCFSALVAISPVLLQNPQQIPWGFILLNIGAVLVTALFSSLAALIPAARVPLLPALKAE
ncbi:MAG TPA: FtsX-like permease family protein, partial [Calditrichia bacterium]|nr:FtsX-like permease family protein [Calditrichia bacterium]